MWRLRWYRKSMIWGLLGDDGACVGEGRRVGFGIGRPHVGAVGRAEDVERRLVAVRQQRRVAHAQRVPRAEGKAGREMVIYCRPRHTVS